jgi:hypothetical protein
LVANGFERGDFDVEHFPGTGQMTHGWRLPQDGTSMKAELRILPDPIALLDILRFMIV